MKGLHEGYRWDLILKNIFNQNKAIINANEYQTDHKILNQQIPSR